MKLHKLMRKEYDRCLNEAGEHGILGVSRVFFRPNREVVVNFDDGVILDASDCTLAKLTVRDILADDWAVEHESRFSSTMPRVGFKTTSLSGPEGVTTQPLGEEAVDYDTLFGQAPLDMRSYRTPRFQHYDQGMGFHEAAELTTRPLHTTHRRGWANPQKFITWDATRRTLVEWRPDANRVHDGGFVDYMPTLEDTRSSDWVVTDARNRAVRNKVVPVQPGVVETPAVGSLAWAKQQAAEGHRVAIYTPAGALQWLVEPDTPDLVFQFNGHYRWVASLHEVPVRGWGDIIDVGKLEEEVRRVYHYLKTEDHAFTFLQSAYVIRDNVVKAIEDTMLRCGVSLIATPAQGFVLNIPIDGNLLRHSAPLPCSLERVHHAGNGVPAAAFDSIGDAVLYLVVRHQYLPLEFDPV